MAACRSPFYPNSSANSSWYRERQEEDWSPRSQGSDQEMSVDSDEENHESKLNIINISDSTSSGLSSLESSPLVPWSENSSLYRSSPTKSSSSALDSRGSKERQERSMATLAVNEYVPKSSSLVIGKRSRAVGLKDVDLTRNLAAKHIREAKEANKSPKKNHIFSPLSRHMSCPAFSYTSGNSMGTSDGSRITGQTGVNRDLNFEANSHFRSPLTSYSSPTVAGKAGTNILRLFSCPDDQPNPINEQCTSLEKLNGNQSKKLDTRQTPNVTPNANSTPKVIEVIDLTSNEGTSGSRIHNDQSSFKESVMKGGVVGKLQMAGHNHSPFKRRVSKKTSGFTFSDDEDSDSNEQHSLKRNKEKPQQPAQADHETSPKSKTSMKGYMKMGIFFTLCVVLLSVYLHVNPHGFCLDSEFNKNISGIGIALKTELYGQHIAQKVITSALKNHFSKHDVRKPLVFSFHGWTGIGKNFVSNIITEHFFKRKTQSPFVHKFIIPLHFPHQSEVITYNEQLQKWIRGNVSHCRKGGLFIFDEMDKIHTDMMGTIKDAIFDYRGKTAAAGYQNMVFIFLSNSGGHAINEHALKHVLDGKLRETLTLSELEIIFHGITKHTPDVWFADLLKSEVIDHLVPFLPLERTHVKQCIRRDLVKKGFQVKEALVTEIADQMEYFPQGYEFFSVSGCKKVSSRVDVIMG